MGKLFTISLFVSLFLLASFYIDDSVGWNTSSRIAMPLSLVLENTFQIDTYSEFSGDIASINGHYYSDKAPMPGFIMTPILYLVNQVYPLTNLPLKERVQFSIGLASILLGALPFALMLIGIFKSRLQEHQMGVQLLILYFFGSFLFAFSGTFFSHALAGLFVFWSLVNLDKQRFVLSGFWLGMGFMTEYTMLVFAAIWVVYLLWNRNIFGALKFAMGLVPFIFLQMLYNYSIAGTPFDFAYKFQENFTFNSDFYGFGLPSLKALYHITISPYRGLLFYTPLLIVFFTVLGKYKNWFDAKKIETASFWSVICYILIFSASQSWYQGWSFGPRYLYVLPVLLIWGVVFKKNFNPWERVLFYAIGGLGVIHTLLDKATIMYPPTEYRFPLFDVIIPKIKEGEWNDFHILSAFGISGDVAAVIFLILLILTIVLFTIWHRKILIGVNSN